MRLDLPSPSAAGSAGVRRLRLEARGAVQGVGFRPFVYRLANEEGLSGWVRNTAAGVTIEVEGESGRVDSFVHRLESELPPLARLCDLKTSERFPDDGAGFRVRESGLARAKTARVIPDVATCPDCLQDILDPLNRRYLYAFTNCTNCGPRFSILESLPYDRERTTMRGFPMCRLCDAEYRDPSNRRFHAQPNACPECGPQLTLRNADGEVIETRHMALLTVAAAIRVGRIVAVKGVGGFHLMADAADSRVVQELRQRKRRTEKPFAVMVPTLGTARHLFHVDDLEADLLASPAAPIVLLRRRDGSADTLTPELAPGNPMVGVMLPSNPVQHLLLREVGRSVVATSGNLSDEPICTEDAEAQDRLRGITGLFLGHDRSIVRPLDDSVVRVVAGRPLLYRAARGYAPICLPRPSGATDGPVLAVGAHQKSTVAVAFGDQAVVSQHLGDLDTLAADTNFRREVDSLSRLYEIEPRQARCDEHPDYRSTRFAEELGIPRQVVQHHAAHVLACAAENGVTGAALGVSWDGTGLGSDGVLWGGEFFEVEGNRARRVAHWREFPLPGGDAAAREPRRSALGLLWARFGPRAPATPGGASTLAAFDPPDLQRLVRAMELGTMAPGTTSVGRLFDAVASLIGLRQRASFEGQAAMELEFAAAGSHDMGAASTASTAHGAARRAANAAPPAPYPVTALAESDGQLVLDWAPLLDALLDDVCAGIAPGTMAVRFHAALADAIVTVALRTKRKSVLLSGGCFQNQVLTEMAVARLREEGIHAYWHRSLPPNDGNISYGQLVAACSSAARQT